MNELKFNLRAISLQTLFVFLQLLLQQLATERASKAGSIVSTTAAADAPPFFDENAKVFNSGENQVVDVPLGPEFEGGISINIQF